MGTIHVAPRSFPRGRGRSGRRLVSVWIAIAVVLALAALGLAAAWVVVRYLVID